MTTEMCRLLPLFLFLLCVFPRTSITATITATATATITATITAAMVLSLQRA